MSKKLTKAGPSDRHTTPSKGALQEESNQHLLDEVSGLIEQEKTLLGLKLLEQQRQAQLWKNKYDELVGKVVKESDGLSSDFPALELIANSMFKNGSKRKSDTKLSVEEIFQNLYENSNADFSKYFVDTSTLQEIVRCLTTRLQHKTFSSFSLSESSLDDRHAEAIGHVIAHSKILALDLSMNRLGLDFLKALMASVKLRRYSPQYLLLQGNEPLASLMTTSSFYSESRVPISLGLVSQFIESSINDAMWGICISLRDFDVTHLRKEGDQESKGTGGKAAGGGRAASPSKSSKALSKAPKAALYADENTHPMQILAFLTSICNSITTNNRLSRGKSSPMKSAKKQSDDKTKKLKEASAIAAPATVDSAMKGVSKLCVLGLMYSQFSKPSLIKLEEVLQLNLNSLVDLDLSFSYIGSAGVEVLSAFLKGSEHTLIRLGLAGNCLHDKGFSSIMHAVSSSETIAFLDMRSNDITDDGLPALGHCLAHNCIISNVNLSGNSEISLSSKVYYTNLVRSNGSSAVIKWDSNIAENVVALGNNAMQNNNQTQETSSLVHLYRNPAKQFRPISMVSRDALLYSIDLRRLHSGRSDGESDSSAGALPTEATDSVAGGSAIGKHCQLSWSWRPSDSKAHILRASSKSSTASASASNAYGFIDLMSSSLSYEVRVLSSKGSVIDSLRRTSSVPLGDCIAPLSGSLDSGKREFNWLMSNVDLLDLPESGTIEVYINISSNRQLTPKNINKSSKSSIVRISAFECMNCELQTINENDSNSSERGGISALVAEQSSSGFEWPEMGSSEMHVSFHQNCGPPNGHAAFLNCLYTSVPKEHNVMRMLNWISNSSKGAVRVDIRLNSTASDGTNNSTGGFIYGYETSVSVISNGRVVWTKLVENVPSDSSDSDNHSSHVMDVFSVWNWKRLLIEFDFASPNDLIIVTAAVKLRDSSGNTIYANVPASKCSVVCKSLALFSIDVTDKKQVEDENRINLDCDEGTVERGEAHQRRLQPNSDEDKLIKPLTATSCSGAFAKVFPSGGSAFLNPENLNFMM